MNTLTCLLLAVSASVGYDAGNLPKFFIDGRPHEPLIDNCGHPSGGRNDYTNVCAYIRRSTAAFGRRILNLGICDREYLRGDGTYDWSVLDDRAKMFLEADPEAKFLIGIRFIYEDWAKRHPGEQVGYACRPLTIGSGDEYAGAPVRPSSASQPFRAAVFRDLAALAEHVRAAPWGERVVAVRPCYGCSTEWFSYGTLAFPDCGQAMTAYFRGWLRRRYGTDAALRAAWHDGSVSLDTATVPSRREQAPLAFFLDAAEGRRAIDFNRATADSMADLLLAVAGEIKRLLPGRLVGAYYGYVFEALPGSCAVGLYERVLSSGLVDFFSNPPAYCHDIRKPGGDYGQKIVPAALRRYGKIPVVEDDSRLHFMSNWATKGWCMADACADRAVLRRNVLNTFFDGGGYQICDPMQGRGQRLHSFDDPGALDALREAFGVLRGIGGASSDSGADMALVITPEDKFFTNTQYFQGEADARNPQLDDHWNVYRGIPLWLHRSGAAFDILTLDDLLASKKTYRKLVFQSAYAVDVARRKALLRLTRREGTTSVWFVAPGSITDDGFSDRAMSDLVGMELTGAGMNPSVTCRDASAKQIDGGWVAKLGKETFSVFRTAVPTSAESAGRLMETIGEHRYVKADAYVRRLGDYLMVHVGKAGRYPLTLPAADRGCRLQDLFTGRTFSPSDEPLVSEGPETWFLKIARDDGPFKLLSREKRDGYVLERREFYPDKELAVEAFVLIPEGAKKSPAVVCLAESGASLECLANEPDPYASEKPEDRRTAYNAVKAGYVALALARPGEMNGAPDDFDWRESVKDYKSFLPDSDWTDAKLIARERQMCAEWLKSLPFVDAAQVTADPKTFPCGTGLAPVPKYEGPVRCRGVRKMSLEKDYTLERPDGRTRKTLTWARLKLIEANNPPKPVGFLKSKEAFLAYQKDWQAKRAREYEKLNVPENPEFTLLKSERRDGYTLKTYEFSPYDGYVVKTYFLVPDGARPGQTPAVICLPGTAGSLECLAGEPDAFMQEWPFFPLRDRQAWWYAQVGMIGVALEAVGNANNAIFDLPYYYSQLKSRELLSKLGMSEYTVAQKEAAMCINFLKKDPLVDKTKIAVSGLSLGSALASGVSAVVPGIAAGVYNNYWGDFIGLRIATTDRMSNGRRFTWGCSLSSVALRAPIPALYNEGGAWKGVLEHEKLAFAYAGHPENMAIHYYDKYADPANRPYDEAGLRGLSGFDYDGFLGACNCDPADHSFHAESALPWMCKLFFGKWEPSAKLQAEIDRAHAEKPKSKKDLFPPDGDTGRKCVQRRKDFIDSDWIPERPDGRTEKTTTWAAMELTKRGIPFRKAYRYGFDGGVDE